MLDKFIFWVNQIQDLSFGADIQFQLTESEYSSNPSARLDIDTPSMIARVTCWNSGDYNAEIIDIETERTIFSFNGSFEHPEKISLELSTFFELIGISI